MNTVLILAGIIAVSIIVPVLLSMIIENLRPPPVVPGKLFWNENTPINIVDLAGINIRYIRTGNGPNLVLLHTLRTQLDLFHKVVDELAENFTVYALDYPGHGFSDIPQTEYVPGLFVNNVEKFLDKLNIDNVTLAGISIGGSISLLIAARQNPRVSRVISINPYDYGNGKGIERGNFVAWLLFTLVRIPVLGETVMRFRIPVVEKIVMQGGVADPNSLTKEFLDLIWKSGARKNHYRSFINLVRNAYKWEKAREDYHRINIPVLLVYGDKDWSCESERIRNRETIPGVRYETVKNGGHFLSLDQPNEVIRLIKQFASGQYT